MSERTLIDCPNCGRGIPAGTVHDCPHPVSPEAVPPRATTPTRHPIHKPWCKGVSHDGECPPADSPLFSPSRASGAPDGTDRGALRCAHTPDRLPYLAAFEDAAARARRGEKQIQCSVCQLWLWPHEVGDATC